MKSIESSSSSKQLVPRVSKKSTRRLNFRNQQTAAVGNTEIQGEKKAMSSKKAIGSRDRISDLPKDIKQRILSFLSISEAIRTSVLSSDWRYDWINLPSLDFGFEFWENSHIKKLTGNQKKSLANRHRNWGNFSAKKELALDDVDIDIDNEGKDYSERCKLIDGDYIILSLKALGYVQFLDQVIEIIRTQQPNETRKLLIHLRGVGEDIGVRSTSVTMDLVATGDELQRLSYYVQEYMILRRGRRHRRYLFDLPKYLLASSKSLVDLELTGNVTCQMFKTMSMERKPTEFYSLRRVSISSSDLHQQVVEALLASCGTAVEELSFCSCEDLKSLELSGLPKLRVLLVTVHGPNRVKINAPYLHSLHLSELRSVNASSCRNLVNLSFSWCKITNDFFNQGLTNFTCLKFLKIEHCYDLTHITIVSNSLADLSIFRCRNLLHLKLDAPNLVLFSYMMCKESDFLSLFLTTRIAPLRAVLDLEPCHAINHTQWHSKFVKLLANFSCAQELTICWTAKEAMIIPQDLRETLSPPLCGVQHVRLDLYLPPVLVSGHSILQYLDTVLWLSSRPKSISLLAIGADYDDDSDEDSDDDLDEDSDEDSDEGGHEDQVAWVVSLELQYKEEAWNVGHGCGCYTGQLINCWRHSLKDFKIKYQEGLEAAAILREFFDNALAERRK